MCGVIGVYGGEPVAQALHDGLVLLQHRGQDAAGIVTCDMAARRLYQRKGVGLVRDVFDEHTLTALPGALGVGHVRYPTAGRLAVDDAQPLYVNAPFGIALAHNGNLTNAPAVAAELFREDLRHINTESDSEVLLNTLAHELAVARPCAPLDPDMVFDAVARVAQRCLGAYAVVALFAGGGMLGFRDPHGVRPLVLAERAGKRGKEYMLASESVAPDSLGFAKARSVAPGEAIYIDAERRVHARRYADAQHRSCIFEHVYFSRPDSVIDDVFVHRARMRMGESLARKILREWPDHDIDVVMPVPDTSRTAAIELAAALKVAHREGFIKNRYIGRTFIMRGQQMRRKSVRQKLHPLGLEFEGKNVLLVDDSIVRGTTSREIVEMAREAGARQVCFASAAPPVRHPNVYGIDIPAAAELIAHGRSEDEVRAAIGADRLFYQSLPDLCDAVRRGNPRLEEFECSIFDGRYLHDLPADYFEALARARAPESEPQQG